MKMLKIFQAVRNVRFPRVWIKMLIVGFDFFLLCPVRLSLWVSGIVLLCVRSKMQVIQQDSIFTSGLAR